MFLSTFSIGMLPLKTYKLDSMQLVGAGLLVGAAVLVIMPEGIVVLVSALAKPKLAHEEERVNSELLSENKFLDHE